MLPEGTLAELINGSIYMSPAPSTEHQRIVRELAFALSNFVKQKRIGEIFFAPYDIFLDDHSNAVQPDIIFISSKNQDIVNPQNVQGVPDMLVEVLSLGNTNHDLILKKELYERFGVKEYWVIAPETKEAVGFTLQHCAYVPIGSFKGRIVSSLLESEFPF